MAFIRGTGAWLRQVANHVRQARSMTCQGLLLVAAAAGLATALPANAQTLLQPPNLSVKDSNGVNLATGKFDLPGMNVAIGSNGSGLSRVASGTLDNYLGGLTINNFPDNPMGGSTSKFYLNASFDSQTYRFLIATDSAGHVTMVNGPYTAMGSDVTLTCSVTGMGMLSDPGTCVMTLPDGRQATFSQKLLQTINMPDGETITMSYYTTTAALKSVSSSLGWMLKYEIDGSYNLLKVTAINTGSVYCDPTASSCSVSSTYPNVTMTTVGANKTIARNGTNVLSYSVSGATTTLTTPSGVTTAYTTYTSGTWNGRVSSVTRGGSTWSYAYALDAGNNTKTTVTEPNSKTHSLTVSYTSQVVSQTDEAGRVTAYGYTPEGRLGVVIQPDGNAATGGFTQYAYDALGNVQQITVVAKNGYSGGLPLPGKALITTATYLSTCDNTNYKYCRKPLTVTDPNGVTTTYTYDANGSLLTASAPAVSGSVAQTRYTYASQVPYILNSSGVAVAQPVVSRQVGMSLCMTSNWNTATLACGAGSTDEARTVTTYSGNNVLPATVVKELGDGSLAQTLTKTYDANGNIIVDDGPKAGAVDEVYSFYDAMGRQVGSVTPDPDGSAGARHRQAVHIYYDVDGRKSRLDTGTVATSTYTGGTPAARQAQAATDWASLTIQDTDTTDYDAVTGLPVISRHFVGTSATAKNMVQRSYDNMHRPDCEAVRVNAADYATAPFAACTLGNAAADGTQDQILKYHYDALNNITSTESGYGTALVHNDFTKTYDVSTATSTNTLTSELDQNGNQTNLYYDDFNRLVKTCYPVDGTAAGGTNNPANVGNGTTTGDCQWTTFRTQSLATGNPTQAGTLVDTIKTRANTTNSLTINFGYDVAGRLTGKSGAVSEGFTYNNFGQILTHTDNGQTETYVYNPLGWMASDSQTLGTASPHTIAYTYDGNGKRTKMTYPDTGFYVTYAYDAGDELTDICVNLATCVPGSSVVSLAYDDFGSRVTLTRANGVSTTYAYDSTKQRLNSLTQGASGAGFYDVITYGYNPLDQITSKAGTNTAYDYKVAASTTTAYTPTGLNQYSAVGGSSFTYDARGNLTSDGGGTYVYNANNLLTSAVQSSGTTTLTYNAENRLGSVAKGTATTKFLYDGDDLIAEYDGSNTVLRRFIHGPVDDEPLVWYEGSGTATRYFYHADESGSINLITTNTGTQYALNTYDAYGVPGAANTGRFQYAGQMWLPEINMYYNKARLYSPTLGRFMQTDPLGYGDGMNWYAYTHNNPVNNRDSSGLCDGPGEERCPPTTVIVNGQQPNGCPPGSQATFCDSGESFCFTYNCGSAGEHNFNYGFPTYGEIVNRMFFTPFSMAYVVGTQNCKAAGDPNSTTKVHMPLGEDVVLPESADGQSLTYTTHGVSAADVFGGGFHFGKFTYNAANGNTYEGHFISGSVIGGEGVSADAYVNGASPSVDQFFEASGSIGYSMMFSSVSMSLNGSGASLQGGASVPMPLPKSLKLGVSGEDSYTIPVGNIVSKGCWTS